MMASDPSVFVIDDDHSGALSFSEVAYFHHLATSISAACASGTWPGSRVG